MIKQGYSSRKLFSTVALSAITTALFACSTASDSPGFGAGAEPEMAMEEPGPGDPIRTTFIDARPAALVEGRVVDWGELRPLLNEAAGGIVLQEVMLDRLVAAELADRGIALGEDDLDRERTLFYETLDPDADVAARLGREVRARQGLGRHRFARLLRRNASLRALVADQVVVSEESIHRTYEAFYGARRQARLIMVPTLSQAQRVIDRLEAGEFFGDVAVEVSTDSSASRGGLLDSISRADPTYPPVLREELFQLDVGDVSPPLLLGNQYAVLLLLAETPARDVDPESVRDRMARRARLAQERILMDQQARALLAAAQLTIIDETLKESWERQFRGGSTVARP